MLYTTKTCPCEYAEDFVALQVLAAAMALRCAGFRWNQELPTAEEDVQIFEPTEIAAAADAGENEEEMCRIQSENTTNFIVKSGLWVTVRVRHDMVVQEPGFVRGYAYLFRKYLIDNPIAHRLLAERALASSFSATKSARGQSDILPRP